jgi:hypothetical protein
MSALNSREYSLSTSERDIYRDGEREEAREFERVCSKMWVELKVAFLLVQKQWCWAMAVIHGTVQSSWRPLLEPFFRPLSAAVSDLHA